MFIDDIKILFNHGKQFIPDVAKAIVPAPFRGRPEISPSAHIEEQLIEEVCPTGALSANPVSIDLGKCTFCGECAIAFPEVIKFTNDHKLATNDPESLILKAGGGQIFLNPELIRKEIKNIFGGSLKLRQISAGGDNSSEWELGACGNVNFDMGRYGIEFVASPRHADGIVITGPISENMAQATRICYEAVPDPKIVVLCGSDAISGGIFAGSPALNRSFLDNVQIDLYVPGNPPHPLTFINGILELTRKKYLRK
jgi:Ni,Fe-hydrogenase III small subunit/NAD-dependent dihydropyrimidine dehydrogenase PreA subunit